MINNNIPRPTTLPAYPQNPGVQLPSVEMDPEFGVDPQNPGVQLPSVEMDPEFGVDPQTPGVQLPSLPSLEELDPNFGVTPQNPGVQLPSVEMDPEFGVNPQGCSGKPSVHNHVDLTVNVYYSDNHYSGNNYINDGHEFENCCSCHDNGIWL